MRTRYVPTNPFAPDSHGFSLWAHTSATLPNTTSCGSKQSSGSRITDGTPDALKNGCSICASIRRYLRSTQLLSALQPADRIDPIARIIATVQADYQGTKMRVTFLINHVYAFDSDLLNRTAEVPDGGHMAGSHRLFRVLRDATSDFLDDDRRYQDAFDEIEYLIGVSYGSDAAEGRGLAGIGAYRRPPIRDSPDRIVRRHSDTLIANGVFRDTQHLDDCSNVYNAALNAALPWHS